MDAGIKYMFCCSAWAFSTPVVKEEIDKLLKAGFIYLVGRAE
jgi:hypothetical protein